MKIQPLLMVHLHAFHPHTNSDHNTRTVWKFSPLYNLNLKTRTCLTAKVLSSDLDPRRTSYFPKEPNSPTWKRNYILLPTYGSE